MNTPFSAAPSAIGYLYQAQHALYVLLREDKIEAKVVIEGLDDISVESDAQLELHQLKHHIRQEATLTNASTELWKTIRVWSESLKKRMWRTADVKLCLITTARAPEGSIGALLRDDAVRNPNAAHALLLSTIEDSGSTTLQSAFAAFTDLSTLEQKLLVNAIVVEDNAPNIVELEPKIKKWLRLGPPPDKIDHIYNTLMGWWYNRVSAHLMTKSTQPISQIELRLQVQEMVRQLQQDSLPIEFEFAEPDDFDSHFAQQRSKNFYRQMEHIQINIKRMKSAVLDYYRAFEQRTKWVDDELLFDADLGLYEKRLHAAWERYYDELEQDVTYADRFGEPDVCVKFGQEVFKWINRVQLPIRPQLPPGSEYVVRGSFHILANKPQPPVYWHPHFLTTLQSAAQTVAQEQ